MPYTEAFMHETYRMSSVVAASVLHSTLQDVQYMGYEFPKDTIIMTNLYHVHHDKNHWGDPENFRPERFLSLDGCFKRDDHMIAFSLGRRSCIGDKLAHKEFFLYLTTLLKNFNIKSHPDHPLPGTVGKRGLILSPHPFKVVLERKCQSVS